MAAQNYPVQILIYVTKEQADALHAMTTNVSEWARKHIDKDARNAQTQEQRREALKGKVKA
jgi:post-segregation antitoxin (ccd killing protein)